MSRFQGAWAPASRGHPYNIKEIHYEIAQSLIHQHVKTNEIMIIPKLRCGKHSENQWNFNKFEINIRKRYENQQNLNNSALKI